MSYSYLSSEQQQKPVEVTGTTQTGEKKFEWNLGRLLYKQPGETEAHAWTVRVLSVLFVLPVGLTAIVDVGRRLAFSANLCNGKSWSLIDQVSASCKALAHKVNSYFTPKKLTLEELNARSKEAMENQAKRLVSGFRQLNGGYLHSNGSFTTPTAQNGEKEIRKAKEALTEIVKAFVARNAAKTENFVDTLNDALRAIQGFLKKAARDDVYFPSKVERTGDEPLLCVHAFREFVAFCKPVFSEQFIELAKGDANFAQSLKTGVDQNILTQDEAKKEIGTRAQEVYDACLDSGVDEADQKQKEILDAAIGTGLMTQEEATAVERQEQPVEKLALATAKDVAKQGNQDEALVSQQFAKIAEQLIEKGKLAAKDQSEFMTEALKHLSQAKAALEADKEAAKKAAEDAVRKAKEEAELAEAQKVAAAQKEVEQAALQKDFEDFLELLFQEIQTLHARIERRNRLEEECRQIIQNLGTAGTPLLDTETLYRKVREISTSKKTDVQKKEELDKLIPQNFGQRAVDSITQRSELVQKLKEKIDEMAKICDLEIQPQLGVWKIFISKYNVFNRNNRARLEEANRRKIAEIEKNLNSAIKPVQNLCDKLRLTLSATPPVNSDAEVNRAEVAKILGDWRKVKEEAAQKAAQEAALRQVQEEALKKAEEEKRGQEEALKKAQEETGKKASDIVLNGPTFGERVKKIVAFPLKALWNAGAAVISAMDDTDLLEEDIFA